MKEVRVRVDEPLAEEIEQRVASGEFSDVDALVVAAVKYYLERHRKADWEEYVSQEIAWSRRAAERPS